MFVEIFNELLIQNELPQIVKWEKSIKVVYLRIWWSYYFWVSVLEFDSMYIFTVFTL